MKKRLQQIQKEQMVQDAESSLNRARSVTVGTAFGGTTEISMRGNNGDVMWAIFQPVEVVELIHQLSASIGCHIHIQPRRDFSSWRDWKVSDEELARVRGEQPFAGVGWPPFSNSLTPHAHIGAVLPSPEQQPGLNFERKENEPVATKKTVNRRSTKRAATST